MTRRPCRCDRESCVLCAAWRHRPQYRALWGGDPAECEPRPGGPHPEAVVVSTVVGFSRHGQRCFHLNVAAERLPNCNGYLARHECDREHPGARPGVECQTCPDFQDDGPFTGD